MILKKSELMSAYNFAKHFGRKSGQFDTKRVDRALGILKSGSLDTKRKEYNTTLNSCDCPDATGCKVDDHGEIVATWTPVEFCKHRIGEMIRVKHNELVRAGT